ncbi:hypothetical protein [Xanthomonas campestris]|uniref:hypothetical protein n=1 Tax=Xanthomonas campestris TaxID=339 RepID=UPI001F2907BE|nr:hypothetical protein [Xanthomonas campestris]MCF8799217.1 hypothetical protein [Xanthomonas campestris pv. campestris]MCF8812159.1 hypothetical protein [Xanthomonas campestris pv. campestris]WHO87439.1 hypothetical protein QMY63_15145 [Xanthomonas campestris]
MSRTQIDWSVAPAWASFAAQDADGNLRWHENQPVTTSFWWYSGRGQTETFAQATPEWKNSLTAKPKAGGKDCSNVGGSVNVLAVIDNYIDLDSPPQVATLADARVAVAELLDFVRASSCHCSPSTQLSSGQTLPAIICARCDALARASGAA